MRITYDKKIKEKAKKLFLQGKTFRVIAKELNINTHQTVIRWAHAEDWDASRTNIEAKSNQLAEQKLVEKLAKDKAEYRNENLKLLDFQKGIYIRVNNRLNEMLTTNPSLATIDSVYSALRAATTGMVTVIKQQDDMLFNRNKVDLQGDTLIHADTLYKVVLDQLHGPADNPSK